MRKNLLAGITAAEPPKTDHEGRSQYAMRGASRSMMTSIDEMAENAKRLIAGETIVAIEPGLIDVSFVSDRMGEDEDYEQLREAIRTQGQLTPVLLRPHPEQPGRYMIVFGHRRARAARDLGLPVRAVVKSIDEIAHVIAQGQENTARANLSFIEKAMFAKKLFDMGQSKDTIKAALTVDDTLLSRLLSVAETVPLAVIEAIGPVRSVGRDRWEELKKRISDPSAAEAAKQIVQSDDFRTREGADRFNLLLAQLQNPRRPRQPKPAFSKSRWASEDREIEASLKSAGRVYSISLKSKDASEFGQFISANLEQLYQSFRRAKMRNQPGD